MARRPEVEASSENVRIVREAMHAFERRKPRALLKHLADDVVWRPTGFLTGEREFVGHEGVRRWLDDVRALGEQGKMVFTYTDEFEDLGERVLVLGSGKLVRASGDRIVQELGWLWELEDGKVTAMTNYLGHAEARAAAGLEG